MRGQITPEQAEEWARDHGKPPFEERPDPAKFDPMTVDDWTLGMATAWIVWRTPDAVRDVWSDFASGCWEWQSYNHREAWEHAPEGTVHAKGSKLEQRKAKSPDEVSLRTTVSKAMGNSGMVLSAEAAESKLRAALRQGDKLVARHGRRAEPIDRHLWSVLSPFTSPRVRGPHDAVYDDDGEVAFKDVTVEREAVIALWGQGLSADTPIAAEAPAEEVEVGHVPEPLSELSFQDRINELAKGLPPGLKLETRRKGQKRQSEFGQALSEAAGRDVTREQWREAWPHYQHRRRPGRPE